MSAPSQAPRALELARTLVGFDTVSAHSNLGLIHCIRDLPTADARALQEQLARCQSFMEGLAQVRSID